MFNRLGDALDRMSAKQIFTYLGIGMGMLILLGVITQMVH